MPSARKPAVATKFRVSSQLDYDVAQPLTLLLSMRAHHGGGQKVSDEQFDLSSRMPHHVLECATTGARFDRIDIEVPGLYTFRYEAEVEVQVERLVQDQLTEEGPETFNLDALPYLYPSRYCQSDRLGFLTQEQFGALASPEAKVRAAVEWIATHITYVCGSTHNGTSAVDSLVERAGVCRDFAHLGIALCRAMNIPARYFTGYAHDLQPPDFHACFETWIGGRWLFWDATRLAAPNGVVRICTGRDAADCSICTAFGSPRLLRHSVDCQVIGGDYVKMSPEELAAELVSLQPQV